MIDQLSWIIESFERHHVSRNGTFAEVLAYLRELQRLRAAIPKRIHPVTHDAQKGWNECVNAMEAKMKGGG